MKKEKSRFGLEKQARYIVLSNKFRIFAQTIHNNYTPMILRRVFLYALLPLSAAPVSGQETEGSNIVSRTLLLSDGSKKIEQRVYDNGLGDVLQEVQSFIGSSLPSIVVHHEYDSYRRRTRTWLPVTSSGSGYVMSGTVAYQAQSQYDDTKPFSRTVYDTFLPSQPSAQYKAGAQWQNNEKKVSLTYRESVMTGMYADSDADGYLYTLPVKKYFTTNTVDEDSSWTRKYTDLNGRVMMSETSQGYTYYVYNARGDIKYAIPPILSDYLLSYYGSSSGHITDDDAMMQKYAYIYRYDRQGHCIYKKLPGCAPIYYVYDRTGALILTQDGSQRQRGEWAYTIPDIFGRPCISGVCSNTVSYDEEPLHSVFVHAVYDGTTTATGGYAVYNITLDQQVLYTAAYYDNYGFLGTNLAGAMPSVTVGTDEEQNAFGLLTGQVAYATNGETVGTVNVYDRKGQVVRSVRKGLGGHLEDVSTAYTFTGDVESTSAQVAVGYGSSFTAETDYTYNYGKKTGMTLSVSHGRPAVARETEYTYDNLGRLSGKERRLTSTRTSSCSYTYDVHGWLTSISSGGFQETLYYADGLDGGCYNGNISTVKWRLNNSSYQGYNLTYDDCNRLTGAFYGEGDNLTSYRNYFDEYADYDCNSNITRLQRRGLVDNMHGGFGLVDNLAMTYDGNMLTSVRDDASRYSYAGAMDFDGVPGQEYPLTYNDAGSLTSDAGRRIAWIDYDLMNNPVRIQFTNGNVTKYVYSATGEKLRVTYQTAVPNITVPIGSTRELAYYEVQYTDSTDYLLGGSLTLKNGRIDKYQFEEGYCQAGRYSDTEDVFAFYYYDRDHLGNIRQVLKAKTGSVVQSMNYYPFGAEFCDGSASSNVQSHRYNGKEFDKMHGLNTYDYGARQYNPVTARWDRVDPLAEKYYSMSPYNYCGNNPVNAIDEEGKKTIFVNGKIGWGSPEAGAPYWGQYGNNPSSFIKGALNYFQDNTYFILSADYGWLSSAEARFNIGYEYAKNNIDYLTMDLKEGEAFNFVSHSMGAALTEGIAKFLNENGYTVSNIVHINPFQAAGITTLESSNTIDFQYINDPVIRGIPFTDSGDIINADHHVRSLSFERPDYVHFSPITQGASFWKNLDDEINKDNKSLFDIIKNYFQ